MAKKGRRDGPTGPDGKQYVEIKLEGYIKELMGATGSADASDLVNKAITTLAWAYASRHDGKRVFATKEDLTGKPDTQELLVDE